MSFSNKCLAKIQFSQHFCTGNRIYGRCCYRHRSQTLGMLILYLVSMLEADILTLDLHVHIFKRNESSETSNMSLPISDIFCLITSQITFFPENFP